MTRRRRRKPKVVNRNHHLELPKDVDRPIPDPGPWSEFDNWSHR